MHPPLLLGDVDVAHSPSLTCICLKETLIFAPGPPHPDRLPTTTQPPHNTFHSPPSHCFAASTPRPLPTHPCCVPACRSEYSRPWQADSDDHWAPEEDWEGDQGQGEGGHRGGDDGDGEDRDGEDVWARLSKKYKGGRRKADEGEEAAPAAKKARRKKAG